MDARLFGAAVFAVVLSIPGTARAFKPYTHNYAASQVLHAIDFASSQIQVQGRWYPVEPRVTAALRDYPSSFLAGSVGPDGFPDLVYGQSVVHPVHTGAWLRYLLTEAWLAQAPGSGYSPEEKGKALAFAYGYLVHAAGDVWSHTLVNELASGVFPGMEDLTGGGRTTEQRVEAVGWAVKHIVSEGVVTDATPGADGDRDHRKVAPAGYGQTGGDISNDATPGYEYDAPHQFLYETMVREDAPTPIRAGPGHYTEARGLLLGGFLQMRDELRVSIVSPSPQPLARAIDAFHDTVTALNKVRSSCNGWWRSWWKAGRCVSSLASLGIHVTVDALHALDEVVKEGIKTVARVVLDAYLDAWIKDIDRGLPHWTELGLALAKGFFDAQTKRQVQNSECWWHQEGAPEKAPEGGTICGVPEPAVWMGCGERVKCEDGIGTVDAALKSADEFVNHYGLSMAGFPDVVGEYRDILMRIKDEVEFVLNRSGGPGLRALGVAASARQWVNDRILEAISRAVGFDVEEFAQILERPSRYMCLGSEVFAVPGQGKVTVPLFTHAEHERLDLYLGLPADHHVSEDGLGDCGRLRDSATYDLARFAPFADTVTMAKLLLLDGPALNGAVADVLAREVHTYDVADPAQPAAANIMWTQNLLVVNGDAQPWLELIDGDHAWRVDGNPVFAAPRDAAKTGGHGTFPLWESCALRPGFRALFTDWENPWANGRGPLPGTPLENFPDLGDAPSADPVNDPEPPRSRLDWAGATFTDGTSAWVGPGHAFTLTATDLPAGRAFPPEALSLERRVYPDGDPAPAFSAAAQGDVFALAGADGLWRIEHRSADPCHTFETTALPVGAPEPTQTVPVFLDQTAPQTTCATPPFARSWATDELATVAYAVADGATGAGVAQTVAILDGVVGAAGAVPVANGTPLDMLQLLPGARTVTVAAVDHVGNASVTECTFEVHATFESLVHNVRRLHAEGSLHRGAYHALLTKALWAQDAARHENLHLAVKALEAFVHEARAHRGRGIVAVRADQLMAYALDLVQSTRQAVCAASGRHHAWDGPHCRLEARADRHDREEEVERP